MKNSYPIILIPDKIGYIVYVPDFNINTEGNTLTEAIEMARDAIGVIGIDMEDEGEALPKPTAVSEIKTDSSDDIVTLVDVDFGEYRRKMIFSTPFPATRWCPSQGTVPDAPEGAWNFHSPL